jgi:hypothetical protein
MELSGQFHTPAALPQGKEPPCTHWTGGWMGPRAVLDAVSKRKIPNPRRDSNHDHPIVQPVVSRYTDWAIPDLNIMSIILLTTESVGFDRNDRRAHARMNTHKWPYGSPTATDNISYSQIIWAEFTERWNLWWYDGVSKSFRTGHLERELQMVHLSATRCSYIAILWVSPVSFAAVSSKHIFLYRRSPETFG